MADLSDEQLLAATPVDRDAFALFYRRHSAPLLGFLVRRLRDGELAADVCAEVFAVALEIAHRFDPERGPALGWLYGIARHKLAHAQQRGFAEDQARRRLAIPPLQLTDEAIERRPGLKRADGTRTTLSPDEGGLIALANVPDGASITLDNAEGKRRTDGF